MFGISPIQITILLVIVVLVFGTKKLKNLGGDLGGALKGFKDAMNEDEKGEATDEENPDSQSQISESAEGETIDVKAEKVDEK